MLTAAKQLVKVEKVGPIASIVLNNPSYNELTFEMIAQLDNALTDVKNDQSVKVVVLKSALISAFSAGAKVTEIYKLLDEGNVAKIQEVLSTANRLANELSNLGKPTVAFIRGLCLGGGNELAMACNWRVATKDSSFGQPEIKLGIIPGMGGTQRLPRILNDSKKAIWLLVTGEQLKAKEALELGLIDEMLNSANDLNAWLEKNLDSLQPTHPLTEKNLPEVDSDEQLKKCVEMCRKNFPDACELLLQATYAGETMTLNDGLTYEQKCFAKVLTTADSRKGIEKFLSKIGQMPKKAPLGRSPMGEAKPVVEVKSPETKMTAPEEKKLSRAEKEEMIDEMREVVRDYCETKIKPKVVQMEKEGRIIPELFKEMADLGFFGIGFSEKYGGLGLGLPGYCMYMKEMSRIHGSTTVMVGAHLSLGCKTIYMYGTEEQKQRWVVPGLKGEIIGAYATTEPSVGSDLANIKTLAKRVDGGWIVNGAKQFITNGAIADFINVLVQTDPDGGNKTQMMVVIEPKKMKGVTITKENEEKMGLHASCTSAFSMEDVFVPDSNVLEGNGFKIAMNVFNQSRISLGAGCVGAVESALEEVIKFASSRMIGGEELYKKQLTLVAIGEIEGKRLAMEALYEKAMWQYEDDPDGIRKIAAAVKLMCSELGYECIDKAIQVLGGSGYITDYGVERTARDFRVNRIFEGTSEVQKMLIAKEVLMKALAA